MGLDDILWFMYCIKLIFFEVARVSGYYCTCCNEVFYFSVFILYSLWFCKGSLVFSHCTVFELEIVY